MVNSVTAEQMRGPDGDAAQAVQRVSGVTVQDGKYVFVRGLGERYTTTSLNGARIPSPEPERKVVPLDLFPSSLLQSITTSKTFTPDQPGDFSGAQVNIHTREVPTTPFVNWSASGGFNSSATGVAAPRAPGGRRVARPRRPQPQASRTAGGRSTPDGTNFPASQMPALIGSFRDVWSAGAGTRRSRRINRVLGIGGRRRPGARSAGGLPRLDHVATRAPTCAATRRSARSRCSDGQGGGCASARMPIAASRSPTRSSGARSRTSPSRFGASGAKISFNNTYNRSADNKRHPPRRHERRVRHTST